MEITTTEILELARKAAKYDGVINYVKNTKYISTKDILAFAGETIPKTEEEEGEENDA